MKKNAFLQMLNISCSAFTAIILVIYIGIALAGIEHEYGLFPSTAFALYGVCLIISAASVFCLRAKINGIIKYFLHLAATLASCAILFRFVNGLDGKTILVALVIIGILHALIFSIIALLKDAYKKEEKYENVYKK